MVLIAPLQLGKEEPSNTEIRRFTQQLYNLLSCLSISIWKRIRKLSSQYWHAAGRHDKRTESHWQKSFSGNLAFQRSLSSSWGNKKQSDSQHRDDDGYTQSGPGAGWARAIWVIIDHESTTIYKKDLSEAERLAADAYAVQNFLKSRLKLLLVGKPAAVLETVQTQPNHLQSDAAETAQNRRQTSKLRQLQINWSIVKQLEFLAWQRKHSTRNCWNFLRTTEWPRDFQL